MATTPADLSAGDSPWRPPIDSSPRRATPHDGTIDELQVVRAVLDGDRDAYAILVDREAAAVIRACQRVLSDLHEAEDVAQEAFVTAYRALARWRGEGPFGAWLTRIAVRLAVRQLGRRKAVTWLAPSAGDDRSPDIAAQLAAGPRTQPEHLVLHAEHATMTRRAVADLDEPYREVVALRFFGERSLEEIAGLTGRPLNTVKTHLRRGLLRLRDRLEPGGPA